MSQQTKNKTKLQIVEQNRRFNSEQLCHIFALQNYVGLMKIRIKHSADKKNYKTQYLVLNLCQDCSIAVKLSEA